MTATLHTWPGAPLSSSGQGHWKCVSPPGLGAAVRLARGRNPFRKGVKHTVYARSTPPSSNTGRPPVKPSAPVPSNQQSSALGSLERQIADNLSTQQPGLREDWSEIEGCWVLRPPRAAGPAKAVLHFIGGAFVGAAPQVAYRLLLESLAAKGLLVVATPFPTGFNHLRIADEVYYRFERCMRCLAQQPDTAQLPVYGLGHSMGSLLHLLIAAQYPVQRAGNAFMAFNNKDVTESIPQFSQFIAPGARVLGPILSQLATSPFRSQVEGSLEMLRGLSPSLVRQVLPILDQLSPLYLDVAQGRQEFIPSPQETSRLVRAYYGVPRNLLLQFEDDTIDETMTLADLLAVGSAISAELDLTVKTLPGDHVSPLQQNLGDLPPELAVVANQAVSQGNMLLGQLAGMANQAGFGEAGGQFQQFAKGISGLADSVVGGSKAASVLAIQALADDIIAWMQAKPSRSASRKLPTSSTI